MRLVTAFSILAAGFAAACVPKFEDEQSLVTEERIVAVQAFPAEAKPGDEVVLRAVLVAPVGKTADASTVDYAVCIDRKKLTELGPVSEACVNDFPSTTSNLEWFGRGEAVTVKIPTDACLLFGPVAPVTESGSAARPVDLDSTGGYYVPLVVGDGEPSLGGVRVFCGAAGLSVTEQNKFNAGYRENENPLIDSIEATVGGKKTVLGEDGLEVRAGAKVELSAEYAKCTRKASCGNGICEAGENQTTCAADCRQGAKGCSGAESYYWADTATREVTTRRESITVAWFTDGGRFDLEQTGRAESDPDETSTENVWNAPEKPGSYRVWIVIRDDRGGTSTLERRLEVIR